MNLLKILSNKSVATGGAKFRPVGEDDHFYQVIPSQHGGIIHVTGPNGKYSFIGITPSVDMLLGEWEIVKEEKVQ